MSFLLDLFTDCFGSCLGRSSGLRINGRDFKIIRLLGEASLALSVEDNYHLLFNRAVSPTSTLFKTLPITNITLLRRYDVHLARNL